ncbi:MAG TPA: RDD family protein [Burkholderiales bacterium]|nr:RDD family protein [Burkholderiales bacterium]
MAVQPGSAPAAANPYAAPQAVVQDQAEEIDLATRGQRLLAAIVDAIVFMVASFASMLISGRDFAAAAADPYTPLTLALMGAIGLVNLYLLHRYRATIGKLALKIRIVGVDGGEIALWRIVFLRGLPQWIVSAIPFVNLLTIVDVLFIFGGARRCVHDYIAGTIVVRAAKQ